MHHFPVFLNLAGRLAVVIGGGHVAERKVSLLSRAGARIRVVAPWLDPALDALAVRGGIEHRPELFQPSHLEGAAIVIAATDDRAVNARVSRYARLRGLPVNVVDDPALSTFIMPAIVDRSPVTVAVSTAGLSPPLAVWVRRRIEAALPAGLGRLAALAGRYSDAARRRLPDLSRRRRFWDRVFDGPVAELAYARHDREAGAALEASLASGDAAKAAGQVFLVGAGPGDPDLLTVKALRLLETADAIVHDRLVSAAILDRARRDAAVIDVGKRRGARGMPQEEINGLLVRLAREGRHVVRLKGGDPFVFGRGGEELEALRRAGIACHVVPGITAATGCAASLGIPLTHRGLAQQCVLVTGHGQDGEPEHDWRALARPGQTLAIYMGLTRLSAIAERLIGHGLPPSTPAAVIENGTMAEERIVTGTLADIAGRVRETPMSGPALVVVGEVVRFAEASATPDVELAMAV